ncbi:hypothetical protein DPEC_G00317390 [Dallia pectoralis]|uniref:Uncharacterized protein n=1 Tax=Dallia pectoralis TaxID=75939 RepID=A0ACC2FD97_DALPE|nr:hypothetical protein DPEC_G00317390 [Dallia pectoralis]
MYPAYGHYAPQPKATPGFSNHSQTPVGLNSLAPRSRALLMESTATPQGPGGVLGSTKSCPVSTSSPYPTSTRPEESHKEKQEVPEAEYLTSRCILFTYYQGDISSVVDEHFSRALSSYMEAEGKRRAADLENDILSPNRRRSFPPSFWDSNYPCPQTRSHCEPVTPIYSMDPYPSGLHPGLTQPHPHPHPSEGWGYAQSQAYGPPRALHELYPPGGLEPHYGALLMPSVRPPHLGALTGHHPYDVGLMPHGEMALNMDAGLQHHKKGKELYWF